MPVLAPLRMVNPMHRGRYLPLVAILSTACAASSNQPAQEPTKVAAPVSTGVVAKRVVPEGHLRREDVMAAISDGPPAVFQRVEVDPVLSTKGKFEGWRVLSINDAEWATGDVRQNDIITRVNGAEVRDPNEFFDVFQSLVFAPALVFSIRRNGQEIEVRYPIDDDPSAAPLLPDHERECDQSDASSEPNAGDRNLTRYKRP
ncbi:MAG: hypothetical protein U0165_04250 [Polyangiaceae bacterium]